MQQFKGNGIVDGVAAGTVFFYEKDLQGIIRRPVEDTAAEFERYLQARAGAAEELARLYERAGKEAGREEAGIFEAQKLILEDGGYNAAVSSVITEEKVCAEYAVRQSGERYAGKLAASGDALLKERAADVRDVSDRIIRILSGTKDSGAAEEEMILAAGELSPSDLFRFERSRLRALVTTQGSAQSHVAILAAALGIPMVSGIVPERDWDGKTAVADGTEGTLVIDPDGELIRDAERKRKREEEGRRALKELKGRASESRSGKKIALYANIGSVSDAEAALENDAEGIGLFRSEFLCMEQGGMPSEEEQFEAYKSVAEKMAGRPVVIRTFDLGGDKEAGWGLTEKENNPALGYRGVRISLDRPEFFRTQLKAILRAARYGNVSLMFPMIISAEEFLQCKKQVEEAKEELRREGSAFREDVKLGVMIETPAAALVSESLAKEADFFSIGSNDLAQYTLALDRQNAKLEKLRDPHHPAVLQLIRLTAENAHKAGIPVGICGELAADTFLTQTFLDLGVDELSLSPSLILPLRAAVRECE